jgi:hypothetical protein
VTHGKRLGSYARSCAGLVRVHKVICSDDWKDKDNSLALTLLLPSSSSSSSCWSSRVANAWTSACRRSLQFGEQSINVSLHVMYVCMYVCEYEGFTLTHQKSNAKGLHPLQTTRRSYLDQTGIRDMPNTHSPSSLP